MCCVDVNCLYAFYLESDSAWLSFSFPRSLSLPLAFSRAGLVLSSLIMVLLAFLAYVTLTWVIESMSLANFCLRWRANAVLGATSSTGTERGVATHSRSTSESPSQRLLLQVEGGDAAAATNADADHEVASVFDISEKCELGEMAQMFMGARGTLVFYALLCIYLFGDLLIYAVFVPVTLSKTCGDFTIAGVALTGGDGGTAYYFFLACFAVLVLPFCFMNFSNTKPLQLFCLAMRNIALFAMIGIALVRVAGDARTPASEVKTFEIGQIASVFGVGIYAFMCHHSLPSIVAPITHKRSLHALFCADYVLICAIYLLLCVSAVYAFAPSLPAKCVVGGDSEFCAIQGPYTLNFANFHVRALADFLTLFPVFTLTSNYPLISITLRNNVRALVRSLGASARDWLDAGDRADDMLSAADGDDGARDEIEVAAAAAVVAAEGCWWRFVRRHGAACVACVPPLIAAVFTQNVNQLVSYTGGFAGLAIQYLGSLHLFVMNDCTPLVQNTFAFSPCFI